MGYDEKLAPSILWISLILALASTALGACGLGAMPQEEPVTIVFTFPEYDQEYYETLLASFSEKSPHITVELNPIPGNMFASLDPSQTDVVAMGVYDLFTWQVEGGILGLNSVIENDVSFDRPDYLPGTVDFLSVEGETWAVPVGAELYVMYYNKDLFDQHNLPYPALGWNWDDFLAYALTINDPEAPSDKVFGYTTTPGYQDSYFFIYQHGGRLFNDMISPAEPAFNDPLTVEAVQFYADLFHLHGVAPTPEQARRAFGGTQYAYYNAIRNGSIGMWSMPVSQRGGRNWPAEWAMQWGVAPLPRDEVQFTSFWVEEGYAISSATQFPDESWKWINFLTWQVNPRLVPARRSLVNSEAYSQMIGDEAALVVRQSLEFAAPFSLWQWINLGGAIEAFDEAIEQVVEGDLTPQEALDLAQEKVKVRVP